MEGGRSDARNAILHSMFSFLGYGERAGSGLQMISSVWKEKNWILPEMKDELNPNRTILILYMKKENVVKDTQLTVNEEKVLNEIIKNPNITQIDLSNIIGITRRTIVNVLHSLKDKNLIERIGSNKKGYWKINK